MKVTVSNGKKTKTLKSRYLRSRQIGSKFDDLLKEETFLPKVKAVAIKRVIVFELEKARKNNRLTKTVLAKRMRITRASVDRIFDPENISVTMGTLAKAAVALGRTLKFDLV